MSGDIGIHEETKLNWNIDTEEVIVTEKDD